MHSVFLFDPNEVQWFDGMVLSCHQFQQEQIRLRNTNNYLMSRVAPYSWGVLNLELDFSSLQNNILRLNSIECILPDYTPLFYPVYDEKSVQVSLSNTGTTEKYVYLVLGDDYTCHHENSRYQSVNSHDVIDMNTGDNKQKLIRLVPRFSLSIEKPSPNSVHFPILKFTAGITEGAKVNLVPYDPPTPDFNQATNTKQKLELLLAKLYAKLQEAYVRLKMKGQSDDFRNYGHIILKEIWPLQVLLNSSAPNPFEVYQCLVRLCASLTIIIDTEQPSTHEIYKHDEIYDSFSKLFSFIENKIVLLNKTYSLGLDPFKYEMNRFSAIIPIKESGQTKIMMQFELEHDFKSWVSNAIIASHNVFEDVKIERTIGCEREIIDSNRIIDNKRCITVKIVLNKECIKSNLLYISNTVQANFRPSAVYLLDD